MKYAVDEVNDKREDKGVAQLRVRLPEMKNAPLICVHVAVPYTAQDLQAAVETRLAEMKQIITDEDTRKVTFDDTYEKVTLSAADQLEKSA